jgi:hypothetical protein
MTRREQVLMALLALGAAAACGAPGPTGAASPTAGAAHTAQNSAVGPTGSEHTGRWLTWGGDGRTWGTFVTEAGVGPLWPLDVAGAGAWSPDGRWLTSCEPGFIAARSMTGVRPSRIAVLNGGCTALSWSPRGDTALAFLQGAKRARLLSFTHGDPPSIREVGFEISSAPGERLHDWQRPQWSPSGNAFLVAVEGQYRRWVDAVPKPGRVRTLATPDGLQAVSCAWAPSGRRLACTVTAPSPANFRAEPRRALALFELTGGELSTRSLFESRGFYAVDLAFVDDERLVVKDRDATRLLHVSGGEPPIILSATAGAFAVSPVAPRVAYVNHRGLCLREAGPQLGPEQLLVTGSLAGVSWSNGGHHLLSQRPDGRAVLVVVEAGRAQQRAHWTIEAAAERVLRAEFSPGATLLLARAVRPNGDLQNDPAPLHVWSLADWAPRQLVEPNVSDRWFELSPDDRALVARRPDQRTVLHLGILRGARAALQPLAAGDRAGFDWQPGPTIAFRELPAPDRPSDPKRQRVALEPDHPITLATAYVIGSRRCTGVLIDPYFVVTAQHCIEDARGQIEVVLGRHTHWEKTYEIPRHRSISHPKVRRVDALGLLENDLALIELPEPAPPRAKPFVLARADEAVPGSEVYLAGYGGDWSVGLSAQPELRHGVSRLVSPTVGIASAIAWRSADGAENGGCFGDSGGPVLLRRSDGSFALLGIHYGSSGTDYTLACKNTGVAGGLVAERAWLNEAADKLTLSRRGSGPPRARASPF